MCRKNVFFNMVRKMLVFFTAFTIIMILFILLSKVSLANENEAVLIEYPFNGLQIDNTVEYENDSAITFAVEEAGETPTNHVDLSSTKYFPPIRSQGLNGSCAAWTTTYYQYTYEVARLNNWDAKHDDSKVFSPKYVWNYLNGGINQGLTKTSCYAFLKEQGSVRWSEFPQNDASVELDWYQGANSSTISAWLPMILRW